MTHRELCEKAAKWLRTKAPNKDGVPKCASVALELVSYGSNETPDVFGWNYWTTVVIECKVSRADFLADAKKVFRHIPAMGMGEYRYYCCPEGVITEKDMEECDTGFGLITHDPHATGDEFRVVKDSGRFNNRNASAEVSMLSSIMRREGIKPQVFNYRNNNIKQR